MDLTQQLWSLVVHDGAWAGLSIFLILTLIRRGQAQTDALVKNAEAITAFRTHLELLTGKPVTEKQG